VVNPKIVRPLRAQPSAGRVTPKPQLNEQQQQDYEQFLQNFNQKPEPAKVIPQSDDPNARFQRWKNFDNRLREGNQLSAEDQKFWAMYQKGNEFKSMQKFAADFDDFDLTVKA
jgi:hypothetical protein